MARRILESPITVMVLALPFATALHDLLLWFWPLYPLGYSTWVEYGGGG